MKTIIAIAILFVVSFSTNLFSQDKTVNKNYNCYAFNKQYYVQITHPDALTIKTYREDGSFVRSDDITLGKIMSVNYAPGFTYSVDSRYGWLFERKPLYFEKIGDVEKIEKITKK